MNTQNDLSQKSSQPLGLDIKIQTPENVVLSYQLAGPALRIGAYLIDFSIRTAILIAIGIAVAFAEITDLGGMATGMFLTVKFFNDWFYYVISETFFDGKSIGKKALGLRVIQEGGYPIDFWASAMRNLLRMVDCIPMYGTGFIVAMFSSRFQRAGDLFARTMVITERRVVLPREPVIIEKIDPIPRDQINGYLPTRSTLSQIDQFLGRRNVLSIDRGHDIAYPLAMALAKKLQFTGEIQQVRKYPMAFLARLYVTFIRSLEDDNEEEQASEEQRSWSKSDFLLGSGRKMSRY